MNRSSSSSQPPYVSVVVATYNTGPFLAPSVESILGQTFSDFELILVDDCSTDGTREEVIAWTRKDPRVRVILNDTNLGPSGAANRGIAVARGEWIARQDADDLSLPRRLEKQVALARAHPRAGFLTTLVETIEGRGNVVTKARHGIRFQPELLPWFLTFYNRVGGHGQGMYRRETILAAGGYDESNRASQDRDLWPRLLRHGPCVVLPEVLYQWRADNPNSITRATRSRYAESSIDVDRREILLNCGVHVGREEAVALRDFWMRFQCEGQDWDAVQRRLLELAGCFSAPRPVRRLRGRLRQSIACGWLANAWRAAGRRDGTGWRDHFRRAREAAGAQLPLALARYTRELAAVGGDAKRLI